jgi:5-formyltetrahydrofolate cyclo-ligase
LRQKRSAILNKSLIRLTQKAKLEQISADHRALAAQTVVPKLLLHQRIMTATRFAVYIATAKEFDTQDLIAQLFELSKTVAVPKIDTATKTMTFKIINREMNLTPNTWGIKEPPEHAKLMSLEQIEVLIVPLLAFDAKGTRLGSGGGYYDRYLSELKSINHKPLILGLGYSCQKLDLIPKDVWDVPLDAILTEQGLEYFTQ